MIDTKRLRERIQNHDGEWPEKYVSLSVDITKEIANEIDALREHLKTATEAMQTAVFDSMSGKGFDEDAMRSAIAKIEGVK